LFKQFVRESNLNENICKGVFGVAENEYEVAIKRLIGFNN